MSKCKTLSMLGFGGFGSALLANPYVLLACAIVGLVLLAIALITLTVYGLVTAVVLFAISGLGLFLLQYLHLIDLTKQPWLMLIPFLMFGIGYFSEHFRIFSVNPQYPSGVIGGQQVTVTLFDAPAQLIILTIVVALVIVAIAALIKRRR